ncbi:hypothetical protein BJX76DRAFT_361368 [Aspergillus varians]
MASEKHEESLYWLKPDDEERVRPNNQHRLLIHVIENKILQAPIDPSTITRIVDVGTGTGIWLDALATYLDPIPVATGQRRQYTGLDMSPANFPASHPENFHYSIYNILHPVPEELKEKYDLVHVRLLVSALSKGDANRAVGNLAQLLRPGGWTQWDELDGDSWAGRVPSPHVREINELVRQYMETKGMELNRSAKMILQENGKPNVEEEVQRLEKGAKADIERDGIFWDSDEHVLLAQKK